jgi:hypothetical protein
MLAEAFFVGADISVCHAFTPWLARSAGVPLQPTPRWHAMPAQARLFLDVKAGKKIRCYQKNPQVRRSLTR